MSAAREEFLELLTPLARFHDGPDRYVTELARSADPLVQVGALKGRIERRLMKSAEWNDIVAACRYGIIRTAAVDYFIESYQYALAEQAAATVVEADMALAGLELRAELATDAETLLALAQRRYFLEGHSRTLLAATVHAEEIGGWRLAAAFAARAVVLFPLESEPAIRLFQLLHHAARPELVAEVAEIFTAAKMHPVITLVYQAGVQLARGNPRQCITMLARLTDDLIVKSRVTGPFVDLIFALRGEAYEKLGDAKKSYDCYVLMNRRGAGPAGMGQAFLREIQFNAAIKAPPLPPDSRQGLVQMVGFPRSGTTLLENALAMHPDIEALEEAPALPSATAYLQRYVTRGEAPDAAAFLEVRRRYYLEIDARRKKPDARLVIDKTPIHSAFAGVLDQLFPEQRYIFSIRHPFDVALSCFKQPFASNSAMENFRNFADTARLYDIAMTQWFAVHGLDDARVRYVRYDDLVSDFEATMIGVLGFLGVPWDAAVRNFAGAAEQRAGRTPSYQKVRQGLTIGVQSSWRTYRFLFESPAARPLHKWAAFFGYPAK